MTKSGDPTRPSGDDRDRALARLEKALKEALDRSEAAESTIEDQRQRLKSLGVGREESMRALAETREELRRLARERDELRTKLARVDSVQTATIALPDDDPALAPPTLSVPSLDDLMSALGDIEQPRGGAPVAGHLHQLVQGPDTERSEEMISPELVFPEEFATTAKSAEQKAPVARILVLLDPERPIKYPLFKETMTIGRADIADIQIGNGFLSRLHARIVSTPDSVAIEDIESKNGIRVNTRLVTRQDLRHGDVIDLGRLRFRFIDTAADDAD
jgi:FHA domain